MNPRPRRPERCSFTGMATSRPDAAYSANMESRKMCIIGVEFTAQGRKNGGIMAKEKESTKKSPGDSFGQMLTAFGSAISEIFNDPELKEKAKEFGDAAAESAKALARRFKDEEVKEKLSEAGKAAQDFGKTVAEHFHAEDKK